MANNFINAIKTDITTDSTLPTTIYSPSGIKAICIELDVSNKSSAGVNATVQIEDRSERLGNTGNAYTIATVAVEATGVLTTTGSPAAAHELKVNDRVLFTASQAPSFTNASLPPSGDPSLSTTKFYYVQSVPSTSTFTIAESKSATSPLSFDVAGSGVAFYRVFLADVVKDAPIPVGGTLKVISGQKLVLEASDTLYAYCTGANSADVIASVLADVS